MSRPAVTDAPRRRRTTEAPAEGWRAGPVLAVGPLPPPHHGVATATERLVALGERRGVPVRVLDIADRRSLSNIGRLDLRNVYLALRHGLQFLWLLVRYRPAVVSVNISQGTLGFLRDVLFLVPSRLSGRGLVVQLHGGYFRTFYDDAPAPLRALIRWTLGGADRVVVLGERLRPIFDGLVPPDRVRVLPNAIDAAPYAAAADEWSATRGARAGADVGSTRPPTVLYLASISEEKGALDLVRAFPAIRSRVPGARVVLCGEARDGAALDRALAEAGLEDSVEGPVNADGWPVVERPGVVTGREKLERFAEADVFVFPTRYRYEGHPFVVLEAMAAGLPVVTTDQGCIAETVLDGETGLLVPQGDIAAIAAATVRLLEDAPLRRRLGAAGRRRVEARYSLERWERDLATILAEAAGGG